MELISYEEAAKITGVTIGSLYQAVSRKDLTRGPKRGHSGTLIKGQVELFENRRISKGSLNAPDRAKWERYAQEVSQGQNHARNEDIDALIDERLSQRLAPILQEMAETDTEEAAAKQRLAEIQGKKEGFRKAFSILRARAAIA